MTTAHPGLNAPPRSRPGLRPIATLTAGIALILAFGSGCRDFGDLWKSWTMAPLKGMIMGAGDAWRRDNSPVAQAVGTATKAAASPTLDTFRPAVPFLGNRTILTGLPAMTDTQLAIPLIRRDGACVPTFGVGTIGTSMLSNLTGTTATVASLPSVDRYLSAVAGLSTTAGAYPIGCTARSLGVDTVPGGFLGTLPNGNLLGAGLMSDESLWVTQGTPAGQPTAQRRLAARVGLGLAIADLNGDGIGDIVASWVEGASPAASGLGVFLSAPDGTIAAPAIYALSGSQFYSHVSVDDVNGDGKLDIVAISGPDLLSPRVSTYLGNGNGTFAIGPTRTVTGYVGRFVIADFTGDGRKDLLTNTGILIAGNGDGSFATPSASPALPTLNTLSGLAVGDLNGDGRLDVAATTAPTGGFVNLYFGDGTGGFTAGPSYVAVNRGDRLSIADVDGDGLPDIVVGLMGGGFTTVDPPGPDAMQFLMNRGDGSFVGAPAYPWPNLSIDYAIADVTGDGKPDLVAPEPAALTSASPTSPGALRLKPGLGDGRFGAGTSLPVASFQPLSVVAGDFDGDGKADLVYFDSGRVALLRGLGGGSFAAEASRATSASPASTAVADFNGDGRADVAAVMQGDGVFVFFGQAGGTLSAAVRVETSALASSVSAGDLNGDGRADLAIADHDGATTTPGTVRVYAGGAAGNFGAGPAFAPAAFPQTVTIGDVDGDGKLDLVVAAMQVAPAKQVFVYLGRGDLSFAAPKAKLLSGAILNVPAIAVGDFNGDGKRDLAIARDDDVGFLLGDGTGGFTSEWMPLIANGTQRLKSADLDADGQPDLVVGINMTGLASLVNRTAQSPPVVAIANDFQFALSLGSVTVASGQAAATTLSMNFGPGFASPISFSCSGLPANARCVFSPATLAPGAGTTVALSIETGTTAVADASRATGSRSPFDPDPRAPAPLALLSATVGLAIVRRREPEPGPRPAGTRGVLLGLAAIALAVVLVACGGGGGGGDAAGGSSSATGGSGTTTGTGGAGGTGATGGGATATTPAGSYPVTLTASGGGLTRSTTFTLVVQ